MIDIVDKISKLSCKYCKFFVDNKCSHEESEYYEDDKEIMVELAIDKFNKSGDTYMKHWAENINDYYVCEEFEDKEINT